MKYWDYEDFDGSLEEVINNLIGRGKSIVNVTILKYASHYNEAKQMVMFPIRALIIYK
jgi:hypothetical protein